MLDIHVDRPAIAEQVRSGDYYRNAREWYADVHQSPLTQRVYMILATTIAFLAAVLGIVSVLLLLPLAEPHAVPARIEDMARQTVTLDRLTRPREAANPALMRFLLGQYVEQRERYRIDDLAQDINGIKSTSTPELFAEYRNFMNPQNPASPLALYQRTSVRGVRILSSRVFAKENPARAQVEYEATVQGVRQEGPARYVADIAFSYTPVTVNQDTGEITPMQFQVSAYSSKEKAQAQP